MRRIEKIQVRNSTPPRIEFDHSVSAWYVRFKNTKVARTLSEEKPGVVIAIDLDAHNDVVGIELLGVKEFSIRMIQELVQVDTSKVDFTRAKFVRASDRELVEA